MGITINFQSAGEARFPDGKNQFDGLLPMERRCGPGASVNERSCEQTHAAAGRRGLRTMQASSHGILLAWLTLSLIVRPMKGRNEQDRKNTSNFPAPQEFIC